MPVGRPSSGRPDAASDAYDLYTAGGTRIEWGRPPGDEIAGEAKAADKVERLLAYARERTAARSFRRSTGEAAASRCSGQQPIDRDSRKFRTLEH